MDYLKNIPPVLQALIAGLFTYAITAIGAAVVLFFNELNRKILNCMLGFSAGVMIAASFWSLLEPSISLSEELGQIAWIVPSLGFLLGGLFIILSDIFLNRFSFEKFASSNKDKKGFKRSLLMVTAVTLHNIPEGFAVGVAFGSAMTALSGNTLFGAITLALGIGIQNFPEGAAVSLVLKREGFSKGKSFFYGQISGLVEPVAAVIGALAAMHIRSILPLFLSFSAGAMILVVVSELLPEAATENKNLTSIGVMIGFTIMMILDVALG